MNSARQENITQKSLIIDLRENQYLWETSIMQHCVVVEFITDEIADIYRKRPTKVWITDGLYGRPEVGMII